MSETHTCNSKCRNPACLIRKERDVLRAELDRERGSETAKVISGLAEEVTNLKAEVARLREALVDIRENPALDHYDRLSIIEPVLEKSPVQTESGVKE